MSLDIAPFFPPLQSVLDEKRKKNIAWYLLCGLQLHSTWNFHIGKLPMVSEWKQKRGEKKKNHQPCARNSSGTLVPGKPELLTPTSRWNTKQADTWDSDAFVLPQLCDRGLKSCGLFMSRSLFHFSSLRSPTPPFPTPPLWSELVSRCEVEWLVSQLWSGCAWIKVVTEQQGGWQMPRTESFSIRLPFQVAAKVKHFTHG